jgi:hypothetical protein
MMTGAGTDGFDGLLDDAEMVIHAVRRKGHCKS